MTEGELLQLTLLSDAGITEAQYFDVLKRKTAYLFSASCEIGSILGGANEKQQAALRDYGLSLGTAFQLIDDVLDFTSNEEALGKAAGADLLGGKVTLPLIYLREADPSTREMIQTVFVKASTARCAAGSFEAIARTGALDGHERGPMSMLRMHAGTGQPAGVGIQRIFASASRPTSWTAIDKDFWPQINVNCC